MLFYVWFSFCSILSLITKLGKTCSIYFSTISIATTKINCLKVAFQNLIFFTVTYILNVCVLHVCYLNDKNNIANFPQITATKSAILIEHQKKYIQLGLHSNWFKWRGGGVNKLTVLRASWAMRSPGFWRACWNPWHTLLAVAEVSWQEPKTTKSKPLENVMIVCMDQTSSHVSGPLKLE